MLIRRAGLSLPRPFLRVRFFGAKPSSKDLGGDIYRKSDEVKEHIARERTEKKSPTSDDVQFLNGEWVKRDKLRIDAFDTSFLRGFAVFDFMRTYNRKPFMLNEHLDRFLTTAKLMGVTPRYTKEELVGIIKDGITKNPHLSDLYIKMYFTGGVGADAITHDPESSVAMVKFLPAGTYPEKDYTQGLKIVTYAYERYLPLAKSTNYLPAMVAIQQARRKNAVDALFVGSDGSLLEGTTQNFFAVRGDQLLTPGERVLYGCTREYVVRLAQENHIPIDSNAKLFVNDIPSFDEAFLTSTTREIVPVVKIDNQTVGSGAVGPVTKRLMGLFKQSVQHL